MSSSNNDSDSDSDSDIETINIGTLKKLISINDNNIVLNNYQIGNFENSKNNNHDFINNNNIQE